MRHPASTHLLVLFILSFYALSDALAAPHFQLPPNYQSHYQIEKFGSHVGDMQIKLNYNKGLINYSSSASSSGMASLFIKAKPKESSLLNWPEDGSLARPQPLNYQYFQSKKHKKNQQVTFSYNKPGETQIDGSYKHKSYHLKTDKIVWPRQLLPLLMSDALQTKPDTSSGSFFITEKGHIQKYTYTLLGSENFEFEKNKLPVLKFKISRQGSQRMAYVWLSKAHFYLPLKIEQYKKGKLNVRMLMTQLKLNQDD